MIVLDTAPLPPPLAARRIGQGQQPCWLASPGAGELTITRELLACDPVEVVRGDGRPALDAVMAAWARARAAWRAGPETPVAVGHFSYDLGRALQPVRRPPGPATTQPSGWPDLELRFYDAFYVWDVPSARGQIWAVDDRAAAALDARLRAPDPPAFGFALGELLPLEPPERHLAAVARVQEYLRAGDAYQVNLARRLGGRCRGQGPPGLALFTRLHADAPAPHALWFSDGARDRALIGNSPERFLRVSSTGEIVTQPIKGTRPRALGPADAASAQHLVRDPKDHAEHVMIVDLERNDLGRVCQVGTVRVEQPLRLLSLPSVFHLVTTVRGQLRPGVELPDILAASFPGGSITGAPKLRAMEIIDELEPACRGPYTGATGWLGAAGDLDLAIAIRTALLDGERMVLWVGGGIVIDSSPEAELEETAVKARAFAGLSNQPA